MWEDWYAQKWEEAIFAKQFFQGAEWHKRGWHMEYKGIRYRSALETKWAITMETLGIPFEYEPRTYRVGKKQYVPDFWLPTQDHFLEIKPAAPDEAALEKAAMLIRHTGKRLFFLAAFPRIQGLTLAESKVYWGDGWLMGPGVPLVVQIMYVLGLPEEEAAQQKLVLAVHHAHAQVQHNMRGARLESVQAMARRWRPIIFPD